MIDRLALSVGDSLAPIIFKLLPAMLSSDNWKFRCAGFLTISLVGEGFVDILSENLGKLLILYWLVLEILISEFVMLLVMLLDKCALIFNQHYKKNLQMK